MEHFNNTSFTNNGSSPKVEDDVKNKVFVEWSGACMTS